MNNVIAFLRRIVRPGEEQLFHYCGYVGVKDASMLPLSSEGGGDENQHLLDDEIHVHGGITFDGRMNRFEDIIPLTDIPHDWYTYHIYGFDLFHHADIESDMSTNIEYAVLETIRMKVQIAALVDKMSPSTGE